MEKVCQWNENYCIFVIKLLILIKIMRWRDKPITSTDRMKTQTLRRARNPQKKATKTFQAKKNFRKERKSLLVKGKKLINKLKSILTGKCRDSWVESVITKVKGFTKSVQVSQTSWMTSCAWRSDSTQCLTITFQSFANGIKASNRNAASEIYSEFIYLCWRLWSPCFSLCQVLLKENYCLKAKPVEISQIHLSCNACMHWV